MAKASKKTQKQESIMADDNAVNTFVSADGKLKAVVKFDKATSQHEIDFYVDGNKITSESYAFHTRLYHEQAAQNYVDGIKKL